MKSTCSLSIQIHRKLGNAFVRPYPSSTQALLLNSCRLWTRSPWLNLWHAQYQKTIYPPWSTFRLMDSLVPNGRKIVNSKQIQVWSLEKENKPHFFFQVWFFFFFFCCLFCISLFCFMFKYIYFICFHLFFIFKCFKKVSNC